MGTFAQIWVLFLGSFVELCPLLCAQVSVLTQRNDPARTGQNLGETVLTPASVSSSQFGKIFTLAVDGTVESQPLYVANLAIAGSIHNVLFVTTEHDSVYAFDADAGGTPLWRASLLDAAHGASAGASTVPDTLTACPIANGEYGISGTPVIDPKTETIYVASATFENNYPLERLHALDLYTGNEKFGGPTVISASLSATGAGSSNGILAFDPYVENQRSGLALANGTIYVAFAAQCDYGNFHGWLMAYDASTLARTSVFLTTPNGVSSGIWMGGAAPSIDIENGVNRLFIVTGNGTYDATTPYAVNTMDYGDDVVRLDTANGLSIADSFTPLDQYDLNVSDTDLGGGGALVLPDQTGAHPHLLVVAGKSGNIYLVDRDNMGGYSPTANSVVQEIDGQLGRHYGLPGYWNGNLYFWPSLDRLKQFSLTNGLISSTPVSMGSHVQNNPNGIGSSPVVSANGSTGGIVWSVDVSQSPEVLYAHDATNVANLLWSSAAKSTDNTGGPVRFPVPTIANGKVYVGAVAQIVAYGLQDFSVSSTSSSISVRQGSSTNDTINIAGLYGFSGVVSFNATGLPAGVTASFATAGTSAVATFAANTTAALGSYQVGITGTSGTISHSVVVTIVTSPTPDFTLAARSPSLSLAQGQSANEIISIALVNGFTGAVTLDASNLPAGLSAAFEASGTSSTVKFTAAPSTALGSYQVVITGTSGFLSHSVTVGANIVAAPTAPDFTVSPNPASLNVTAGSTATAQIQLTPNSPFSGNITLSCSVAPALANVTCSVPASVTGSSVSAATLTIVAAANADVPADRNWPHFPVGNGRVARVMSLLLFGMLALLMRRLHTRKALTVGLTGVLLLGLSSCRGGSPSTTIVNAPNAVNETGAITVVALTGMISHRTTVTVTVQ
jgi:hypothetical protein